MKNTDYSIFQMDMGQRAVCVNEMSARREAMGFFIIAEFVFMGKDDLQTYKGIAPLDAIYVVNRDGERVYLFDIAKTLLLAFGDKITAGEFTRGKLATMMKSAIKYIKFDELTDCEDGALYSWVCRFYEMGVRKMAADI